MASSSNSGSTQQLLRLCAAYFLFYVITGITVKYFLDTGMKGMTFLVYSTLGGSLIVFPIVIGRRWYRLESNGFTRWGPLRVPRELGYIIPSGICTAVVIPTTTLMYTLPITIMVAMTMMRGSVIVISRVVDEIQIRQGILHKRVYPVENLAVVFAMGAVGVHIYAGAQEGDAFDFLSDTAAMAIFISYIVAYAVRIYLMNYFKNTRAQGVELDNKGFFAIEQFAATGTLIVATLVVVTAWDGDRSTLIRNAFSEPPSNWAWATLAGSAFGCAAFFSVFLFMFKGRTATFAGLVNRLTSLIAGTVATLLYWVGWGGKGVKTQDWIALIFVMIAVACLSIAERQRNLQRNLQRNQKAAPDPHNR